MNRIECSIWRCINDDDNNCWRTQAIGTAVDLDDAVLFFGTNWQGGGWRPPQVFGEFWEQLQPTDIADWGIRLASDARDCSTFE